MERFAIFHTKEACDCMENTVKRETHHYGRKRPVEDLIPHANGMYSF